MAPNFQPGSVPAPRRLFYPLAVLGLALFAAAGTASNQEPIAGQVISLQGDPIAGARVGVQGTIERAVSDHQGRFQLTRPARQPARIVASKIGYLIAGTTWDGDADITIPLQPHSTGDNPHYEWIDSGPDPAKPENCANCHVEIYREWSVSSHARSAVNERFLNVFYGTDAHGNHDVGWNFRKDQPEARAVCSACHLPTVLAASIEAEDPARASGVLREGIHCDFCHKIAASELSGSLASLGLQHGRDGLKIIRPERGEQVFFGPRDDVDRGRDSFSPLYRSSSYCASCHEGTLFGTRAYETFSEWRSSSYAQRGVECQHCHMKPGGLLKNTAAGHGGLDRDPATIGSHHFAGSTDEDFLRGSVEMSLTGSREGSRVFTTVVVTPIQVGHRLPTGSPDRHLILAVCASTESGAELKREAGPVIPQAGGDGIAGAPGKLYGKLLAGPDGIAPVPFWRAVAIQFDSRLHPDQPDTVSHVFLLDSSESGVVVTATLKYRRFYQAISNEKSWAESDIILAESSRVLPADQK